MPSFEGVIKFSGIVMNSQNLNFFSYNVNKKKMSRLLYRDWSVCTKPLLRETANSVLRVFTSHSLRAQFSDQMQFILVTQWHSKGLRESSVLAHSTYHCLFTAIMCVTEGHQRSSCNAATAITPRFYCLFIRTQRHVACFVHDQIPAVECRFWLHNGDV